MKYLGVALCWSSICRITRFRLVSYIAGVDSAVTVESVVVVVAMTVVVVVAVAGVDSAVAVDAAG